MKTRLEWIDIAKCLAIILVVDHSAQMIPPVALK